MKTLTRSFCVSLTILAIVGLLFYIAPMTKAAESYELDGYVYQLDKQDCATIIAYKGSAKFLIIPKELDGHPVVSIGELAFSGNKTLRSAAIPEGVTEIKNYAFHNCTSLFIVGLPDTLTRIGVDACGGCTRNTPRTASGAETGRSIRRSSEHGLPHACVAPPEREPPPAASDNLSYGGSPGTPWTRHKGCPWQSGQQTCRNRTRGR